MRKRLFIGLGLVVVVLGACYLTLWLTTPRQRVRREAFEHIRVGMTLAEIEAIVGLPPGDYTTRPSVIQCAADQEDVAGAYFEYGSRDDPKRRWREWIGDQGLIVVRLNAESKVSDSGFCDVRPAEPSFLERLRKLLGLGG